MSTVDMAKIVSLSKRRGFVFPSSEVYGGLGSTWDYGPLGVELKNNVKRAWWRANVYDRDDMEGLDGAILMNRLVWKYSGHEATFSDPLVDCRECKGRFRADKTGEIDCPKHKNRKVAGCSANLTEPRAFNLMFKTNVGPVEEDAALAYLRPETAQSMFVNFQNVVNTRWRKIPFGIAQVGKAFRNEIVPGNFTFRTREFEQMEIEFFCKPGTDDDWHKQWIESRYNWYLSLGMRAENIRHYVQQSDELAHYAKACTDLQYRFFPEREDEEKQWDELEGIANRTDFDLKMHSKGKSEHNGVEYVNEHATERLTYFDQEAKERYVPYVIEPSAGADRATLAFLMDAYSEKLGKDGDARVVLRLHPHLAPIKVAVMPLARNKPAIVEVAHKIKQDLQKSGIRAVYDDTGAIGRLYARQDEIGTPYCVTVDYDTLGEGKDGDASGKDTVTVRDRDTWEQIRLPIEGLKAYFLEKLS
ncbi:MAG: glycine--tRNA ligase [Blastocatellia bacterium]|nr:glycine--tRNA ligase [Blastocatellia bacterium]